MPANSKISNQMKAEGYISAQLASEICLVDLSTVHRWVSSRKVEHRKLGRWLFISIESLIGMHTDGPDLILDRLLELSNGS